jgi:FMN phosphatase YigB (HAD superfamily)
MKSDLTAYQYFIFDLDNTLYPEIQYLQAAWLEIGNWLQVWKPEYSPKCIAEWLSQDFHTQGRTQLLNRFIQHFDLEAEDLNYLLDILRTVQVPGGILLFPDIQTWLKSEIIQGKSIFIITNGNPVQQKNKFEQLQRYNLPIKEFLMANTILPKPDPAAFLHILHKHRLNPTNGISIGDSVEDRQASEAAGIAFMPVEEFRELIAKSDS